MASYPSKTHYRQHSEASSSQQTLRDSTYSGSYAYQSSPKTESYALLGLPSSPGTPGSVKKTFAKSQMSVSYARFDETPTGKAKYLNPYYIYPSAVLVLHTLLLIFSWTFYSITISRPVPLRPDLAVQARDHFQSVTMVVTLLASFISLISGTLYTRAIRYALARFIAGGVSLYVVTAATKMAKPSPIKNFRRPLWTISALILALAVNSQTASWATLMVPRIIEIESRMRGYDLDLASFGFKKLMDDNKDRVNADLFTRVIPITEASGSTAVSTIFNLPSILNFNHFSYTNSTCMYPYSTCIFLTLILFSNQWGSCPLPFKRRIAEFYQ